MNNALVYKGLTLLKARKTIVGNIGYIYERYKHKNYYNIARYVKEMASENKLNSHLT
jgi:abortive infection bacteriophage resistance protein